MKFFKEHNRWPEPSDEDYIYDTRFFSPKQTRKDIVPLQQVVDQLHLLGSSIPLSITNTGTREISQ